MPITERHFHPTMIWADIVGANMSNDTWAIVIATFMGPIFAVLVSLWREGRNDRQNRRYPP